MPPQLRRLEGYWEGNIVWLVSQTGAGISTILGGFFRLFDEVTKSTKVTIKNGKPTISTDTSWEPGPPWK